jgi:hypothetical protein
LLEGVIIARSKNYTHNTVSREQMKHSYYEMSFGGTINLRMVTLTYSQNLRTPEFKTTQTTQNMYWGSLSVNVKI